MRLDRTAILHFLALVIRSVAGFGTTILAARYFGAAGLGVYSQFLALLFWLKLPSNSLLTAISKRMSETDEVTGHFTAGLLTAVGYGIVLGAVLLVISDFVNGYLGIDGAYLLVLLILTNIVFDIVRSGFEGSHRVAIAGWLGTGENILRLSSQLAFVVSGAMVLGLVVGHIVSLFVFALLGLFFFRSRIKIPTKQDFGDLRRFAQYSWLGNLQGLALSWMDILVLGYFVANDFVGIYQASWTLASFLALTSKSISKTLFPELSALGANERLERARDLINDGMVFAGVFLIPGAFGAALLGERLLRIYRAEFTAGATILVLLITARLFYAFGSQFVNALNGLDRPDVAFRINAVFVALNMGGNVLLVYLIGWYGAAFATTVTSLVYCAFAWHELQGVLVGVSIPAGEITKQLVASAAMAVVLWPALPYIPVSTVSTVALVFAGAVVYSVVLLSLSSVMRAKIVRLLQL